MKRARFALLTMFMFFGCDSKIDYVEWQLPEKNPTSYEFPFPLERVKRVVRSAMMERWGRAYTPQDSIVPYGEELLSLPENRNDFFVPSAISATSIIYREKETGEQLQCYGSVHVHLTPIGENSTSVEVRPVDLEVFVGRAFPQNVIRDLHGGVLTMDVEPSTVEEYQLLLRIGEELGVKDEMPPLKLPVPPDAKKR